MHENTLCQFCKITECNNRQITCETCHSLYWEFAHFLTVEQNDELQLALHNKKPLPSWFEPWWAKMKKIAVFL
jgi:hypothetical protein